MGQQIKQAAKGIYSGLIAGLGSLSAVLTGPTHLSQVSAGQWVIIAIATLTGFGVVYGLDKRNGFGTLPSPPPQQ